MAHFRNRFLQKQVLEALSWSPAVGLYGLRQVGKSTLVEYVNKQKSGLYETLDQSATLAAAQNRPAEFCARKHLLCIDEAQKCPALFPVIKDLIGTKRKPGQFLLTGSTRFTLKKEIREALTGRTLLFELLPFTVAETLHKQPSPFLQTCFEFLAGQQSETAKQSDQWLEKLRKLRTARSMNYGHACRYLVMGGMPIPCFSRDPLRRKQWYEAYFESLITRDLVLVDKTLADVGVSRGRSFLRALALAQGQELNNAALAHASALSLPKSRRMMAVLVALCLVDLIVPEEFAQKSQKKLRVEWKDVGLWNYFCQVPADGLHNHSDALDLILSQEFRFQIGLLKKATTWTYYRSHNGARVPWIFRQGQQALAIMSTPLETPGPYQYRALKQFVEREPESLGIILGPEKSTMIELDKNIFLLPFVTAI